MKQKFKVFEFVHISNLPCTMDHFPTDCDAIIEGSYKQICHMINDVKEYSVYIIEDGKIIDTSAWYPECVLTSLDEQDISKAAIMIQEYNTNKVND